MKLRLTPAEHAALIEKSDNQHRVLTAFGTGGVTLDTDVPVNAWALPVLLEIRDAAHAEDHATVREAVFDAVSASITELYFRNSGRPKQDRDADANEITEYVMGALDAAYEKIGKRKEKGN